MTTHCRLSPPPSTRSPSVEEIFTNTGSTLTSKTRLVAGGAEMLLLAATQESCEPRWARETPETVNTFTVLSPPLASNNN